MACQAALAKRGVAVLIVPVDISKAAAPAEPPFTVHKADPLMRPSDAELDRIAWILSEGKNIAIYGGSGCQGAHDEIVALAEKLKAPVAHTSRAKDFIEYDNPCNVGMTGMLGTAGGYHTIKTCDTLLLLGCDFAWRQFYPDKARIVQVDIDPTHLGRRHPVELGVVGDIKATVAALLPKVKARSERGFLDECVARHDKALATLEKRATAHEGKIHPQYLAHLIDKHAAEDAIFTADGGSPTVWLLRHVKANGKRRTLISLTHGTMANAMPQALGAKRAFPDRQVISMSGDGGLAHDDGRPPDRHPGEDPAQDRRVQQRRAGLRRAGDEGRGPAERLHRPRRTPTSRASPRRSASMRGASSMPTISRLPCRIGWRSQALRFSTS